jgi:hypothetical protein
MKTRLMLGTVSFSPFKCISRDKYSLAVFYIPIQDAAGVHYKGAVDTFQRVLAEGRAKATPSGKPLGARIFLSGIEPRVMWISIGGFVFFGAYEYASRLITPILNTTRV